MAITFVKRNVPCKFAAQSRTSIAQFRKAVANTPDSFELNLYGQKIPREHIEKTLLLIRKHKLGNVKPDRTNAQIKYWDQKFRFCWYLKSIGLDMREIPVVEPSKDWLKV